MGTTTPAGRVAPTLVGVGALGACVVVALVDPGAPGRYPLCPFRLVTGLDCPGCGTLRAVHALSDGRLLAAADHNLATVVLLPLLLLAWVRWLRGGHASAAGGSAATGYAVAAGLALFWVVRNLPWAPWSWLGSGLS